MPLVISAHDVPEVDLLLVSGGVRNEEDLYNLRRAVPKARKVIAIGTCAISGGVASSGDRDDVRQLFMSDQRTPSRPPSSSELQSYRLLSCRLTATSRAARPLPRALHGPAHRAAGIQDECESSASNAAEKKLKDMRPSRFAGFQRGEVEPGICLINQGFLCIGSSTRGGCRAPCPRAGHPCVGCRGPSDVLIEKESAVWLTSIKRVISALTDIPDEEMDRALRSPHLSLFLFQFSDYSGPGRTPRPKEKVM